jgi:MerR family transcriptional regulator, light-induced transcriptional regulator
MASEFQLPSAALAMTPAYLTAKLEGDREQALRVALDGLDRGIAAPELALRMIAPAQREVGRLWQANRISVAQEHLCTSISQIVLSRLYPLLPRNPRIGKRSLVACIEGELHDLGARMGADFLEMRGFDAEFLGANVPLARLLSQLQDAPVDLLGLSATMPAQLPSLKRTIEAVRGVAPALPIIVGGGLLEAHPHLFAELGLTPSEVRADALADNGSQLVGCR